MNAIKTAPLVWHNGNIVSKELLNLDIDLFMSINLVETFFTNGTEILFPAETFSRIKSLLSVYKFDSTLFKDDTGEMFINEVHRLLIRNFSYKTSRCFLLFSENKEQNSTDEFLFIEPAPNLFNTDKLLKHAIISSNFLKPSGIVMNFPTIENEYRKLIRSEFEHCHADDSIILDQEQNILETYYGNIFLIDQKKVFTPSANSGCTLQLLRSVVIKAFKDLDFDVIEIDQLLIEALFDAKEVMIAGPWGIYSLKGFEYKRYFDYSRKIVIEKIVSEF
jgi:branched-subunit amino acid aminotransferase/4-amino-4-deoxychorismate lyase